MNTRLRRPYYVRAVLFPRPTTNLDGHNPIDASTYRPALHKWLKFCDIRDEHGGRSSSSPTSGGTPSAPRYAS